ncbi:MAG TPA: hypothetical protein PKY96_11390 [Flavobacteriales bacterium]|nr:hypothetical protein [Flavobacteriales bacterium]
MSAVNADVQVTYGPVNEEVLSPESFVFVALMSVEEGPNKASFLPVASLLLTDVHEGGAVPGALLR